MAAAKSGHKNAVQRLLHNMLKDNALSINPAAAEEIKYCSLTALFYGYCTYFQALHCDLVRTYEVAAINLVMDNMNNTAVHIAAMKGREDNFKVAITTLAHAANKLSESFSTCFVCLSLCYHIVCHHAQQAGQKAILIGSVLGIMFVVSRPCYLQPLKGLLLYSPRKMARGKPHSNWRLTKATLVCLRLCQPRTQSSVRHGRSTMTPSSCMPVSMAVWKVWLLSWHSTALLRYAGSYSLYNFAELSHSYIQNSLCRCLTC
jgi:hypothetical protein